MVAVSGEVHPGGQSWVREGPVLRLRLQRGGATGQQGPVGKPTQIHAGALIVGTQVLPQRWGLLPIFEQNQFWFYYKLKK